MSIFQLEVLNELTSSIEEEGQSYLHGLSIPAMPDDQMPESGVDRDKVC